MKYKPDIQLSHMDGIQDESEQRSEAYVKYVERAAQVSTQRPAICDSGASGSARKQTGTVREL